VVANDDMFQLQIVQSNLESAGINVLKAAVNGQEAFEFIAATKRAK